MSFHDSHNFKNDSDKPVRVFLEPGEIVEVAIVDGRPSDRGNYSGEEFGYELEVQPGESIRVVQYGN